MTKKHDKKCPQVPRLRFPEFQNAEKWKDISLNEIASPVTDRATNGGNDTVLTLSAEHGVVVHFLNFGMRGSRRRYNCQKLQFLFPRGQQMEMLMLF